MFKDLKNIITTNFNKLIRENSHLFYVSIDRDIIWDKYLDGFENPVVKQDHNCNCCKSFLRQFGGIVAIQNNKMVSIWDINVDDTIYKNSIKNLSEYIHSLPITDIFINDVTNLGTDTNKQKLEDGTLLTRNHFYLKLDPKFICRSMSIDQMKGEFRSSKDVLKRSLDELVDDASKTVLELIDQNSLYRGSEFEHQVREFYKLQKEYSTIDIVDEDNFCWQKAATVSNIISRIRNSAIGTLLINISEGMDLDQAVAKYEKVVAPTNYKRPAPIITERMIETARKTIEELGYNNSLNRRFANEADLDINNLLFTDKSSAIKDVFNSMQKEVLINPKTLSKVEEIHIDDFVKNVLPNSKSIEVLLNNSHHNNLVSLITGEGKSMFKWDNNFSWSYTNGITDSIKERVKSAGGKVDGELRVSLSWFNYDDLDIHVIEPDGTEIYYSNKMSRTTGCLDIDMNARGGSSRQAVENIVWSDKSKMIEGNYKVLVHNFILREHIDKGFIIELEYNNEIFNIEKNISPKDKEYIEVLDFNYSKTEGITFKTPINSEVTSKEKWGVKTNQFIKVKNILLSPNYWNNTIGNKHFFFILDGCINDETPRAFFNEFLKEELLKEKRTFEVLGGKVNIEPTNNQLSGIGFSDTQRNSLIVRVESSFKRTLKIIF